MEDASPFVEPRKTSFSSKVLPYSTPESRPVGCFTAPSPNSTGLPSRQPSRFPRSTPYRVSGESLLYQDRRLLWPNPFRHDWPIHLRLGGYESISTSAWVYAQHSPVVRPQLDGAQVVSQQRGEEQTLRVTRESHPTLHSLQRSSRLCKSDDQGEMRLNSVTVQLDRIFALGNFRLLLGYS